MDSAHLTTRSDSVKRNNLKKNAIPIHDAMSTTTAITFTSCMATLYRLTPYSTCVYEPENESDMLVDIKSLHTTFQMPGFVIYILKWHQDKSFQFFFYHIHHATYNRLSNWIAKITEIISRRGSKCEQPRWCDCTSVHMLLKLPMWLRSKGSHRIWTHVKGVSTHTCHLLNVNV